MGTFLRIIRSTKILLVLKLFILLSIPLVLSVPITGSNDVGDVPSPKLASLKFYLDHQNAITQKTRTARQSNYPLMIYGGCYPPGLAGGWGWGPQPPNYPPYNLFRAHHPTPDNQSSNDFCDNHPKEC
ncbi:uncharacterized protein LOC118437240 [Folsomia candida]|uniref:uncharacterized protein LOC118437240 n=1 Tax=Folsomia candida TaxID=158441 RepID=UPI001604A1DA|nr:uncharacterized protein LOC118437240 [Folsomia candida]